MKGTKDDKCKFESISRLKSFNLPSNHSENRIIIP